MDKRYQVFVSSTFADLEDERKQVIQTLMEIDCIPAGMELFPAMDEEQFEFIKKVIDDCDYYLLIIGARYGSISADDGLSYTEKEYLYAKEKGMKVIALVHGEPDQLPVTKTDKNPELYEKLVAFRKKVCTGRIVKFWKSPTELPQYVALSLLKIIKAHPAVGWVRGDTTASTAVLSDLLAVKNENEKLREELAKLTPHTTIPDLAGLDKVIKVGGRYMRDGSYIGDDSTPWVTSLSFSGIFQLLAPNIIATQVEHNVKDYICQQIFENANIGGYNPSLNSCSE